MKLMYAVMFGAVHAVIGCGTQPVFTPPAPTPQRPVSVVPTPPVVVAPPPITNMDILRSSCPGYTDSDILTAVQIVDDHWFNFFTFGDQIALNRSVCQDNSPTIQFEASCNACWDAVANFIFFVFH